MTDTPPNAIERTIKAAEHLTKLAAQAQAEIDAMDNAKLSEVATYFIQFKEAHAALETARKLVGAKVALLDKTILPKKFENAGSDKIRVPEIGRSFYTQTKYSCSMIDKEKGPAWLREKGAGDIIQETVNAGTLAAFMNGYVLEHGEDPPEDIFKVSSYYGIGSSKYKPKT